MVNNKEIVSHNKKIEELKVQIQKLKENFKITTNTFLPDDINQKILDYEVEQLENELLLHKFCIFCLREQVHTDLVKDSNFTNAKKKKLNKLVKKYSFSGQEDISFSNKTMI